MTARTAEPTVDTVFNTLKKWWDAATMTPTTIQTTPTSEMCRPPRLSLTTAERLARAGYPVGRRRGRGDGPGARPRL